MDSKLLESVYEAYGKKDEEAEHGDHGDEAEGINLLNFTVPIFKYPWFESSIILSVFRNRNLHLGNLCEASSFSLINTCARALNCLLHILFAFSYTFG